ncbi:hypothetical protein [Alicyclobacillus fodiniaquatilis]|jgi:hypothetical protein|uniref:Uncharacterized protein n=1 Tax=Alicyclobacillus fodiniaquatilis TaxID=1661150 RepID=A0ABW4JL16_9BACL
MATYTFSKETLRVHVGRWVECHSVYGLHHGILHRALHDGVIITNATSLASGQKTRGDEFTDGSYRPQTDDADIQSAQFFPYPGMFIPYGGIYGFRPLPFGFVI